PSFYNIPFMMHDEDELQTLMKDAGFKNCKTSLVKKEGISESAASLSKGMTEGNPIFLSIIEKDPALVEKIEKHVEKILAEKFGNKPLKSPLAVWICEGEK
ncbi:MAG TPA: hypothetical protein VET23_04650, partial [Chitinophagaceae bacterium]|nr:hypothetical protein [Chitinophagaceae bacterium]